jgi:predicted ATP-grasp superfamily ATP-dependent carboligase
VSSLRWHHRPKLRRPVLVAAFEGWNDAGDAASGAARWLADRYGAEMVATIEAEEFFDFTTTRPIVEITDEGKRRITWPDTELWSAATDAPADLILMVGHEPHLRWRTYCKAVTEAADALDVSMVLTLGALLSDVPHSRPTAVSGTADDVDLIEQLDLTPSTYEGPTGIVGVLHHACQERGIPSASLWAAVPTYVSGAPSPKATLALVERASNLLGLRQPVTDLQIASAAYERQIDELVEADEDTAAYVAGLEEAADDEERDAEASFGGAGGSGETHPEGHPAGGHDLGPMDDADPDALIEEVERFLKGD